MYRDHRDVGAVSWEEGRDEDLDGSVRCCWDNNVCLQIDVWQGCDDQPIDGVNVEAVGFNNLFQQLVWSFGGWDKTRSL